MLKLTIRKLIGSETCDSLGIYPRVTSSDSLHILTYEEKTVIKNNQSKLNHIRQVDPDFARFLELL